MNTSTKVLVGIIVAVVVVWGIAGTLQRQKTTQTPTEPIKIGVLAPLTGDAAVYGEPLRNVIQIAVDEINAQGGVGGQQLSVIYEDAKCNGKDAASAMQKLVSVDKVQAVIGGFCSSESLAAVPIAAQAKVFLFSAGSSSPDLTGISPFFVRNYPSDASQGQVLADIAWNQTKWKTVAFMQEQKDYPLGIYKAFSKTFEGFGGNIVKEEFASDATDFRSPLAKLRAAQPDALFIDTQTPAAAERVLKQLQELKWVPQLLVSDAVSGDPVTVEKNKMALEGTLAAEFGVDPANPKFQHLLDVYKQKYGADVPYQSYAQTIYDAVYMLKDALMAMGNNGEKLAAWFHAVTNWQGASGSTTIGADGDRVGGHTPKVIRSGKVEVYK